MMHDLDLDSLFSDRDPLDVDLAFGAEPEPHHRSSPTAALLEELALTGWRPGTGDPDPRQPPEDHVLAGTVAEMIGALAACCRDTLLEPDLPDLLWSAVNLFHRAAESAARTLDDNEQAQRRLQRAQDGSEVKSVELERLLREGELLVERHAALETMRDRAAAHFEIETGSTWRPRAGSLVNRRAVTSAIVDSRDFISAKRRAETEVLVPKGTRVAFAGGAECNDHAAIWAALDKVHAKHPDMVLLHGGSPKGAELIAQKWAEHRHVAQVVFKPDWTRHGKAAPFRRNDLLLEQLPVGLVAFPGNGITGNLVDKARALGIRVMRPVG